MHGIELTPEHDADRVVELAETAAGAGFDAILVACHYFNRDPFVVADRIARATDDVLVGPAAANPYETHPVTLASRVGTLAETSDDRALFGLGPGDRSTLSALGVERDSPLRRVLETMQVARRLFDGETVDHDGTVRAADAELTYDVGSVPIHVAAQGPHMTRMAGKYADGILFNGSHPADLSWARERVAEGVAERADGREDPELLAYASVSVDDDAESAREAARPPVAFIVGGAAPPVLDRHGIDSDAAATVSDRLEAGAFREAFGAVTPAMIDAFAAAGSSEAVAERLAGLLDHADGVLVGAPLGPDLDRGIELAADALDAATGR
jgi:5,10-methylenetetrahydromethanopterin reductase